MLVVKLYENNNQVFSKRFVSDENGTKFAKMMEEIVNPDVEIETECEYTNQVIPSNAISDMALENIYVDDVDKAIAENKVDESFLIAHKIPVKVVALNEGFDETAVKALLIKPLRTASVKGTARWELSKLKPNLLQCVIGNTYYVFQINPQTGMVDVSASKINKFGEEEIIHDVDGLTFPVEMLKEMGIDAEYHDSLDSIANRVSNAKEILADEDMNEALVIQTSLDTDLRDKMFDLFSRVVCGHNFAHILHLNADSGGQHLMLEKIYDELGEMIDKFGEVYFMARNIKIPNPLQNYAQYGQGDMGDLLTQMSACVDAICTDPNCDESLKSMISGFGEGFQRCLGFWRQASADAVI